jgi:hypothetical protein
VVDLLTGSGSVAPAALGGCLSSVAAGKYDQRIALHLIDQTMLAIDASRPAAGQAELEGLGLAGTGKGGSQRLFDQLDDA